MNMKANIFLWVHKKGSSVSLEGEGSPDAGGAVAAAIRNAVSISDGTFSEICYVTFDELLVIR